MGTSSFICNIRLKAARRIMEEKKEKEYVYPI